MQPKRQGNINIKALWVVLIDHSGSMRSGFSASAEFQGFTETGHYENRLTAAKEILFKQIAGFAATQDIAVISFTAQAELLFKCSKEQVPQFKQRVDALQAGGGTDIAGALNFAHLSISNWEHYDLVRFLVISDGESDVNQAQEAALKCFNDKIFIDTVLIDPNPRGLAMAEAISLGGKVTAVKSSADFSAAVEQEREAYEQDMVEAKQDMAKAIEKEAVERRSAFGGILTIIVGVITVLSLAIGIAVGLSGGNIIFKISILVSVILVLVGVYLLHLANEAKEQIPLYVGINSTRMVSVLRRTGKKRTLLLFGGWGNIVLGILVLLLALFVVPDSPILATPTPTATITPTPTFTVTASPTIIVSLTPTVGSTKTPKSSATKTPSSVKTLTPTALSGCEFDSTLNLKVGDIVKVSTTDNATLSLRFEPGTTASVVEKLNAGSALKIIDGATCKDGYNWWKVQFLKNGEYIIGWVAEGDSNESFLKK